MNVSLTPELESLVAAKVASGRYLSASEVVREALRLFEQHEKMREISLHELRLQVNEGLTDLEAGRHTDYDRETMKKRMNDIKKSGRQQRKKKA